MLGASISWFIGLLRAFAMFVDIDIIIKKFAQIDHLTNEKWWNSKIPKELKTFIGDMVKYLASELVSASDSLCFEFHNNVLQDLPKSMHVIL